jgi:hypothetical protein
VGTCEESDSPLRRWKSKLCGTATLALYFVATDSKSRTGERSAQDFGGLTRLVTVADGFESLSRSMVRAVFSATFVKVLPIRRDDAVDSGIRRRETA